MLKTWEGDCNTTCSMLRVVYSSGESEIGEDNRDYKGGGGVGGWDVKTGKVKEAVLPSLSLLYSNNDEISVCDSKLSSCSIYMFNQLLFLLTTNARWFWFKKTVLL